MFKVFILTWLFPVLAQAAWSSRALTFARTQFGYFPGPSSLTEAQRGAIATVWGGGMRDFRFHDDLSQDEEKVRLPGLLKKEVRVYLRVQTHRAPLVVVIPGVFTNANESAANQHMRIFSKLGYHVLTLPNCWSTDLVKAQPLYSDEYPSGEATVMTALARWAIAQIRPEKVTNVQLIGESLGALTVAVMYARDSQLPHPLFTGGATMTWPPINLHNAVGELDTLMTATDRLYRDQCHGLIKRLATKWRIIRGSYILHPTKEEVDCAPAIVAQYSFRKELIKLAKVIRSEEGRGPEVSDHLTFAKFIRTYAPRYAAALKETDSYGSLRYWLGQTTVKALKKVQILSSKDDFLNDARSWDEPGLVGSRQEEIIVAHWGGHVGLADTRAYEGLLRIQFALH